MQSATGTPGSQAFTPPPTTSHSFTQVYGQQGGEVGSLYKAQQVGYSSTQPPPPNYTQTLQPTSISSNVTGIHQGLYMQQTETSSPYLHGHSYGSPQNYTPTQLQSLSPYTGQSQDYASHHMLQQQILKQQLLLHQQQTYHHHMSAPSPQQPFPPPPTQPQTNTLHHNTTSPIPPHIYSPSLPSHPPPPSTSLYNSLQTLHTSAQAPPPCEPPQDQELYNTIHHVAEYCAQYSELEDYVRKINGHEHKFRFLVDGEGASYFKFVLYCYKNGLDPFLYSASQTNNTNLTNTNLPTTINPLSQLVKAFEEPTDVPPLSSVLQSELQEIVNSLEHQATQESIRKARHWVEMNSSFSEETCKQIAYAIRQKFTQMSNFTQQLHLLYVVHDALQNEIIKTDLNSSKRIISTFKPYLVWILRSAYQGGLKLQNKSEEMVSKILNLWLTRKIINEDEMEKMNSIMTADQLPPSTKAKKSRFDQGPNYIQPNKQPQVMNNFMPNVPSQPLPNSTQLNRPSPIFPAYHPFMPPPPLPGQPYIPMVNPLPPFPMGTPSPPFIPPPQALQPIPPPPPISGFDKRPELYVQNPENTPVGLMASMLRSLSKRGKNMQTAFVPYKPLDPMSTPQFISPLDKSPESLQERVDSFYQDLRDVNIRFTKSRSEKSKSSRRRSSPSRSPSKTSSSPSRSPSRERLPSFKRENSRQPDWDRPSSWAHEEMGVGDDGSVLGGPKGGERLGLGAGGTAAESDAFERFRQQRANKYHEHIAHNQANRREPSRKIPDSEKLCYICQQPGHIAKDCKYGLP